MILHPVSDISVWLRLLGGVLVAIWLPGFWILGRFTGARWPARIVLSLMAGILAASGVAMFTARLELPFTLPIWLIGAGLLGLGVGFWPAWRRMAAGLADGDGPYSNRQWLVVAGICLAVAFTVIQIEGEFPVPPAVHDSGNHAFLTLRILETGHADSKHIFDDPYGQPQRPYFTGWHAAAAMVCRCCGLPPYVGAWLFSLLTLALLPCGLVLVWREFGLRPWTAVLAASFLVVCGNILVEIPWRGGMGQFVGMFCMPLPMIALVRCFRRGAFGLAILAGAGLASLVWIHGSWTFVALLLAVVALFCPSSELRTVGRRSWLAALAAIACFALIAVWDVLPVAAVYKQNAYRPQEMIGFGESLTMFMSSVGGWVVLRWLTVVALLVGLLRRDTRSLSVLALLLGLLSVTLASVQDPFSLWIGQPWYQIFFRLHRPQVFLLPPLVAVVFQVLWQWRSSRIDRRYWGVIVAVVAVGCIAPARFCLDDEKLVTKTLFTDDDVRLANRMSEVVPEGSLVANWRNDGSCWAMHMGQRYFINGTNWILGETDDRDYRFHVKELIARRKTPRVVRLQEMKCDFIWATDHWMFESPPILRRVLLNPDPCFTPVLEGRHSTLYRVEWDRMGARKRVN